jgi:hypothetical protein
VMKAKWVMRLLVMSSLSRSCEPVAIVFAAGMAAPASADPYLRHAPQIQDPARFIEALLEGLAGMY